MNEEMNREQGGSGEKPHWQALLVALQFLTVVPVRVPGEITAESQGRSLLWYPAVGLLLGLVLAVVAKLLASTPSLLVAVVVLTLWVLLTGALHLDGLADCADALLGGLGDREKTLRLLKDPLCGSSAVITLVLVLLLKVAALSVLLAYDYGLWLLAIPLLARLSLLWLFLSTDYVRPQGLGEVLAQHFPRHLVQALLVALPLLLLPFLPLTLWLLWLVVGVFICWSVRRASLKRLGGFTGDCAGAQVELVEAGLLLAAACLVGG